MLTNNGTKDFWHCAAFLIGRNTGFARPSVCQSVCPVRAPNSKTKRHIKNQNRCERSPTEVAIISSKGLVSRSSIGGRPHSMSALNRHSFLVTIYHSAMQCRWLLSRVRQRLSTQILQAMTTAMSMRMLVRLLLLLLLLLRRRPSLTPGNRCHK